MRQEKQNKVRLDELAKTSVFLVPEGYFVRLPENVLAKTVENNVVLKQSALEVPNDYFSTLAEKIEGRIAQQSPLSQPSAKASIFQTPADYFEDLTTSIQQQTNTQQQSPLSVPEAYFDSLADRIEEKVGKKGKVIKVDFRTGTVVRYAVAASLLLLLSVGGLFYFNRPTQVELAQKQNEEISKTLIASLDKQEIAHYLEKQDIESQELVEYATVEKQQKIHSELGQELMLQEISKQEHTQELRLDDLDMDELPSDI